jgi:peptide/nickel transport system substrate-binding protein
MIHSFVNSKVKKSIVTGMGVLLVAAAILSGCTSSNANNGNNTNTANNTNNNATPGTNGGNAASPAVVEKLAYHLGDIINPEQVNNFNPFLSTGNWRPFFDYVYHGLYYFNPVKGELIPQLADGQAQWSKDQKTLTVKLRTDVKWHDGEPFTADDVVYTYNVLKDHVVLDTYKLWSDTRLKDVRSGEGNTVVFELNDKFPSLPNYLSTLYIVPKHIFEKEDPETFQNKQPIGTGAFKFKSINESAILFEGNADYFRGAPQVTDLIVERFKDSPTLTLSLQKGDIQGSPGTLAMPSLPKLLEDPNNKLQQFPGLSTYAVIMNNEKPGLSDLVVRKAIQLAIDRAAIVQKGEMGAATIGNPGFLSQAFGELVDTTLIDNPKYQFNIEEANKLLQDAGYKKNDKGVYEKGNVKLSFTYYMAANAPAQNKEGAMITDWLKQIGIETTLKQVTWPELTNLAMSGNYDLVQNGITVAPDPQAALEVFHSKNTAVSGKNTAGLNWARFRDKQVDDWLDQASNSPELRPELYKKIQNRIAELAPIAVIYSTGKAPYSISKFDNYDETVPVTSALSLSKITKK